MTVLHRSFYYICILTKLKKECSLPFSKLRNTECSRTFLVFFFFFFGAIFSSFFFTIAFGCDCGAAEVPHARELKFCVTAYIRKGDARNFGARANIKKKKKKPVAFYIAGMVLPDDLFFFASLRASLFLLFSLTSLWFLLSR